MGRSFWNSFGPGLLWAATAIGISHLVQSTRAGAIAGFSLWWLIVVAMICKYPVFEFGPRYAAATGESLIDGYRRVGRWAVWLYFLLLLAIALVIQVVGVLFTAVLFQFAFGPSAPTVVVSTLVLGGSIALLAIGRFRVLDLFIKVVVALLALSTLIAAGVTAPLIGVATLAPWPLVEANAVTFSFLLALLGFMPSGVNLAVFSSLWTLAKNRDSRSPASVRHVLLDFRIGYVMTGIMALAFIALGAGVMHNTGEELSPEGMAFSMQLVEIYVSSLGSWARPVVTAAVVTTIASSLLMVVDGFPRAMTRTLHVLSAKDAPATADDDSTRLHWIVMAVLGVATIVVISQFRGNLVTMVDIAAIISFLLSPVFGYLNLHVIRCPHVPEEHRPGNPLIALTYVAVVLLGITAIAYVAWKVI